VNANFTDVATMITDSLPRDGQAGMTGQLLAISGATGEPGISWTADPDTGIRRPSGNEMALVCGGTDIFSVSTTVATSTVPVAVNDAPTTGDHLTNKTYVDAQNAIWSPIGKVDMFAGNSAPTGWLECDGAAVSRTTYAALYAVIGTVWGAGDGSTTFNVPDLRGEFVRGWDHGRGIDASRAFASAQADSIKSHAHPLTDFKLVNADIIQPPQTGSEISKAGPGSAVDTGSFGGSETRPRNIALMFIIKT